MVNQYAVAVDPQEKEGAFLFKRYFESSIVVHNNLDDNGIAHFAKSLWASGEQVFREIRPPLQCTLDVDNVADLDPGTQEVPNAIVENAGVAQIIARGEEDYIPTSSTFVRQRLNPVVDIGMGWDVTQKELDAMAMVIRSGMNPNFNILQERQRASLRAMDELFDRLCYYGSSEYNLNGFFNDQNVTFVASAVTPYTVAANDPITLVNWIVGLNRDIKKATLSARAPNTVLMNLDLITKFQQTWNTDQDRTAWVMLLEQLPNISFEERNAIYPDFLTRYGAPGFAANTDEAMVIYHRAPDTVKRRYSPMRTYPLEPIPGSVRKFVGAYTQVVGPVTMMYPALITLLNFPKL